MPLPWLLLGAGALIGGAAHLNAEEKNDRAKFIADNAKSEYERNQSSYTWAESNTKTSLQNFGSKKQVVLGTSVKQFVSAYEKVKHIQFNETIGIEELKNYQITIEGFNGLVQWTDIYESKFSSAAAGAATGALTTLALGGDIAAIGSALSVGGAALAAGEIGVAGAALGAAITPLAALAVPAVLFSGISANIKADENLKKAEEYAAKVNVAIEKMKTATVKYNAIKERTDILNNLLNELNSRFSYCTSMMDAVIRKKIKKNKNKPLSGESFTEDELKLIAITRALAGAVKSVLDTPLLSSNGDLTQESADNINRLNAALPKLKEQAQTVQNTDYGVKPKNIKVSYKNNKGYTVSNSSNIVRDVVGLIVGIASALVIPFNFWGKMFVFSIIAMLIGSNEPENKLIKIYQGLLISTMWISSFALFMLGAVSLVNMSHYIIVTIIIGIIAFVIFCSNIDSIIDEDLNTKKIFALVSSAILLFCVALLIFAFLYKFCGFIVFSKILVGLAYGFILIFCVLISSSESGELEGAIAFGVFIIAVGLIIASVRGNEYATLFGKSHKILYNGHSPEYSTSEQLNMIENASLYDLVEFGNYNWYVIVKDSDYSMLFCEESVDKRVYNKGWDSDKTTWEECSLREWLNNDFYNSFSESEKAAIILCTNENPDNSQEHTDGGNTTEDYVFLLTMYDAEVLPKSVLKYSQECWLRSPGVTQYGAAVITEDGKVDFDGGYGPFAKSGVRPLIVVYTGN